MGHRYGSRRRLLRPALFCGLAAVLGWCLMSPTRTQNGTLLQLSSVHRWFQTGRASWYGHTLQGLPTASGESYDMNAMTCAHRSLPLGALVRVTNLLNHRSVVVRVNDRGPMVATRIVDLSYAAARVLRIRGTARVRVELIDAAPSAEETSRLIWPEVSSR